MKKYLTIFSLVLIVMMVISFWPQNVKADITFDATSNSGVKSNVTSFTWTHTNTTGDFLVVGCSLQDVTTAERGVSGVTYNGIALTVIREDDNDTSDLNTSLWRLVAPAAGALTIEVTLDGTVSEAICGSVSLVGVDQTDPVDNSNTALGNGTSASVDVITGVDNTWVVDTAAGTGGADCQGKVVGADQTQRWLVAGVSLNGFGSTEVKATAGTATMSWTVCDFSVGWITSVASFNPSIPAVDAKNRPLLKGEPIKLKGAVMKLRGQD